MAITPETDVYLLKVPLEIDNKNQLTFQNKQEQIDYFLSLDYIDITGSKYQRKDGIIRYPAHIDSILDYNYVIYKNSNYSDKWFFAFVTNMRYINDAMTEISIVTDVWQTWQFDLEFKESFIEREMINVAEDIPGANLIPEGLETGEFKVGGVAQFEELEPVYIIAYSGDTYQNASGETINVNQNGHKYNGIYSAITYMLCDDSVGIQVALQIMNVADNSSKIITVFTVPKAAVKSLLPVDPPGQTTFFYTFLESSFKQEPIRKTLNSLPNNLDGYVPKNKKLLTYPYIYLGFNPPNGSQKIYRYENFPNGTPVFDIISELNPNPTVAFIPQNYRGDSGDSLGDMATLNGYPTVSYKNDYFNTWLAQNSQIIDINMAQEKYNYEIGQIQSGISGFTDIATNSLSGDSGRQVGVIPSAINLGFNIAKADKNHEFYVKNQMAQIEKQKMLPDTVTMGSSNATLLGYELIDNNIFTRYTIKRQFAERIDKFFDMYGYLTNTVKIPNINNRRNWNYVKTIGANIHGFIPQEDLQAIKTMFDSGITLWHNVETFLDYSQNNR